MRRHRWASQPPPVSPKVMGARMKKMAEQKRMAKGRVVRAPPDALRYALCSAFQCALHLRS